ncbi:BQ2448_6505 [Microbotryum intermedium]|uniref:BQ2448_6505 protein n=1 Tax=Microbotryum intermedium TaxID=269621 RepID=A0A238FPZ1_9BASI|nr:BQ2448_6505 [Microbotryum intermedium]
MAPVELHVDALSKVDVFVHPSAYPPSTQVGDLLAIRPLTAATRKNKGKDRALLFKVDRLSDGATPLSAGTTTNSGANADAAAQGQDSAASSTAAATIAPATAAATATQAERERRRPPKAQVLVSQNVQQTFKWIKPRTEVVVEVLSRADRNHQLTPPPPDELVASHVELYFNNLYLSRPDMFRLTLDLARTCLFINQRVTSEVLMGARLRVGAIFNLNNHHVRSAYITDETKIIFRSESARCFIFVEISQEMWHFEEDGSMLRERCEAFLDEMFQHWSGKQSKGMGGAKNRGYSTSHNVSIILYGRVIYEDNGEGEEARAPMKRHENGTLYRDFFKVIMDLTPSPHPSIVRTVAQEIQRWHESVLLRTRPNGEQKLAGRIAYAHESPVLEATNLALNSFEEHWIDRDLQRTGLEVLVLTAGTSYYEVPKGLLRLTTERMLYHGIGLDLISLSKTPLHTVPLFAFQSHEPGLSDEPHLAFNSFKGKRRPGTEIQPTTVGPPSSQGTTYLATSRPYTTATGEHSGSSHNTSHNPFGRDPARIALSSDQKDPLYYDSSRPLQETSIYYAEPMFIFCSFFGLQVDKPHRIDRFMPRARCYELFSQGIGERTPIAIPLLLPINTAIDAEDGGGGANGEHVGYLSEWEKRQAKREKHDALAVGARDGLEGLSTWSKESGAMSATTENSVELANNAGGRWDKTIGAKTKGAHSNSDVTTESESDGSGRDGRRLTAQSSREKDEKAVEAAKVREREMERVTREREREQEIVIEKERGRQQRISEAERVATSSRSKTPMPGRPRSASVATSVRTVSSGQTKTDRIKSATPALIARLTNTIAAPSGSGSSAYHSSHSSRPGWLGLFRGPVSSSSATPAPSVAVQRVEARANVTPQFDLDTDMSVASGRSEYGTSSPPVSYRTSFLIPPPTKGPTLPISIKTRSILPKDADRPSRGLRNSPSLKQFTTTGISKDKSSGHRSTASRFNPSKPGKQSNGLADQARRWASIFVRHANDQRSVNWVSITRGACLPLTTDFLPTAEALATEYSDFGYAVPTSSTSNSFLLLSEQARTGHNVVAELVLEMVAQRLSHGFQLVTPANHIGALDEINVASSKTLPDVLHEVELGDSTAVYLTLANQIHRIWYDRRTQAVHVKIMRRRRTWSKENYNFSGLIFTQGSNVYRYTELEFPYPSMIEPDDWQHLDRLVAGAEKPDLRPSLRYWRTRLVLLPAKTVPERENIIRTTDALEADASDAMINDQGFYTFRDLIESARWIPPGADREQIPISHTPLTAPEWASMMAKNATSASLDLLSTAANRAAHSHQSNPHAPRLSTWLSRLTNTSQTPPSASPQLDRDLQLISPISASEQLADIGPSVPSPTPKKPMVQMSHAVIVDLDHLGKKSSRAERVICHLDRSHNRNAAYHLELNWLSGSGKIIDNAIQAWSRQVQKFGLTLIEVSTRAVEDLHNPFQSATILPFKVPPPPIVDSALPKEYYEASLLRSLGFFLDIGADSTFPSDVDVQYSYKCNPSHRSQYIHRSGTVLVAILGDRHGFAIVANRIYLSHKPHAKEQDPTQELVELCVNLQRLRAMWDRLGVEADRLKEKAAFEAASAREELTQDQRPHDRL